MSKVILVVEQPQHCAECNLSVKVGEEVYCVPQGIQLKHQIQEGKHEKCPLKPLPGKSKKFLPLPMYTSGWNDCIEAIIEEE